jgi:acyl carrier protein
MNREEVFEKVQEIFRDIFDDQNLVIGDSTNASDIDDWDSLNQINLIVAFEKEFKVKFNFLELSHLKNVGEMVDLTMHKLQ